MRLKEDYYSHSNLKKRYGEAGEQVKVINNEGDVWIVENEQNERFAIHKNKLTDKHLQQEQKTDLTTTKTVIDATTTKKHSTTKHKQAVQQPSLF